MSDETLNVFRLPNSAPPAATQEAVKTEYQAVDLERTGSIVFDVWVYYGNGQMELVPYAGRVSLLSEADDHISWITSAGSVVMVGSHLRQLIPHFQERTVKVIRAFMNQEHREPPEGAPVFDRVEWRPHPVA